MKGLYQLVLLLILMSAGSLKASHIVGGHVSYRCVEPGRYEFTINMYRNCNGQSNDVFAAPAPVTIYRGNAAPYTLITTRDVFLSANPVEVPLDDNPCIIIPPDVCVEEGKYIFELLLPVSTESYHITFQRCCRNASISNIDTPNRRGATFTIELLPAAQQVCNSSPDYNAYPPAVICVNKPILVDHSATDPDGDELVYSLCPPLEGAGPEGAWEPGSPTGCNGFMPDPACPPPYFSVPFILPDFSVLEPIPGNPPVGINSTTGQLTGIPNLQGQFAVGLCVSEYRNGVLLSVVRRDFQFNVTMCDDRLNSGVDGNDIEQNAESFVVHSCEEKTIEFINTSTIEEFIDEYKWEFFVDGGIWNYATKDVTVTFPDYGQYTGRLILNPNNPLCQDTGFIEVNIYPEPTADFGFTYDTCVAGEVSFVDLSLSPGGAIDTWEYQFNDGDTSDLSNPSHLFAFPANHQVDLTIVDENGCTDEVSRNVSWFPAPAVIIIEPSSFAGCSPLEVFFENLSFPIDSTYNIDWDLGDGSSSNVVSPGHTYTEVGAYSLKLGITSPIGCYVEESWDNWIKVHPNPEAAFNYSPSNPTNFNPVVSLEDESVGGASWEWYINDGDFIYGQEASYTFQDTGLQKVELIVENIFGCLDTAFLYVDIAPEITYFLPNAFTPNNDGKNEEFVGVGYFRGLRNFQMQVFNRWGELIFSSNNPENGWNGRRLNTGRTAPNGVYPLMVQYQEPRGDLRRIKGFITLIR